MDIGGGDGFERIGDGLDQVFETTGLGASEPGFDLAPHLFDRIEIESKL
jgi:hypothetical protein